MIELIPILETGEPAHWLAPLPASVKSICSTTAGLYLREGFHPPWIGYLAWLKNAWVGTCAFKTPPRDGRIEIAYFTFPEFEGRKVATRMAAALVEKAWATDPAMTITAQTLPKEGASAAVLRRRGFSCRGTVQTPEDGPVWEWILSPRKETL